MSASHELWGQLEGLKVKPHEEGTDIDIAFSFPFLENRGSLDLAALSELAGKRVVVTIESEQARLPLRSAGKGGEAS